MNRFDVVLERIGGALDTVPQPQKYHILKELSDDFYGFVTHYLEQGYDEEEAAHRAAEKVTPDPETLKLVVELNRTPTASVMRRFSAAGRQRIETAVWVMLALTIGTPIILPQTALVSTAGGSPWFWSVGAMAVLVATLGILKTRTLYLRRDHSSRSLDRFMGLIPFAGMQAAVWALLGFFTEVRDVSHDIATGLSSLAAVEAMLETGLALLIAGALTLIASGLLWLVLSIKTVSIREYEKAFAAHNRKDQS